MPSGARGAAHPTSAVACVLWRQAPAGPPGAVEVYLAQRAGAQPFFGGFWCFAGGRVEAGETATAACAREVREELGVALPEEPGAYRALARFITPDFSPVRFDTIYFLVEAPAGAAPDPSVSRENEAGAWIRPADALARARAGDWLMPTPVALTLAELARGEPAGAPPIEERLTEASRRDRTSRLFPLAAAIAVAPLRTPTLPPAVHTNAYVIGDRELVVIDPGSPWEEERAALVRELEALAAGGARVVAILLTHHHGDHAGGAADLSARLGAPVWAHAETARLLRGRVEVARALADGEVLELGGDVPRRLRALFT